MAKIPASYLPARGLWPERVHTLPEHRAYPERLNSTEDLVDRHVAEGRGDRATLLFEDQTDGWCRAGDFVTMDADGYVWFLSREDDLIKSSGYRIGPEEIEDVVITHPSVADCCVIGVPDAVRGQNTRAYVVLKPRAAPAAGLEQSIIEFCREHLAAYKLPREIQFVESVPRAAGPAGPGTGKLLRRVLRNQLT
jgi:acyl-coenzyme A synthetase/AMP-(fatty) acid ligase